MSDSNLFYKKKKSKKLNRRTHRKTENPTLPCQTLINVTTKSCTVHHWFFREKITKIVHLYNVGCTRITHFVHLDSYPILLFKALFFIYWLFFFFFSFFFFSINLYTMYRTLTQSALRTSRLLCSKPPPTPFVGRPFSTQAQKSFRVPFKTISASVALTSSFYIYSQSIAQAEAMSNDLISTVKGSNPSVTISELQDKDNRIAVQAKSTQELAMALFIYRLCSFPWLVDAAPYLISAAERLHLQDPVYWLIKQTFFRHFCGGETSEECISSMDKLAQSGINCILDLSVEADLHLDKEPVHDGQGKYHHDEQQADVILKMIKSCIQTAAGGRKSNAMVAVKVTAFSPPELLLRLNQAIATLDQSFFKHQVDGHINAHGLSQVIQTVLPPAKDQEQQNQRQSVLDHLEREKGTLDLLEFRKLFNLQGPGRHIWWETDQVDPQESLLTSEDLGAYDRMIDRVNQACSLAHQLDVGIMVDAEQSYFQDAIDHVAVNLKRKYNRRAENEQKGPTIYNTCKIIVYKYTHID